ncbi:MAG: helix-turn-helix domain-containing protein [Alistipes sp.]|nr:helix-turn-helix domain-containing protein [Alistipes sp.]
MYFKRLRDLREDADLTQTELSKHLNVSKRSYSHYENGTRNIPVDIIVSIADFYDVSVDYILERTNNRKVNR